MPVPGYRAPGGGRHFNAFLTPTWYDKVLFEKKERLSEP
jgi:hypothetical protein